MIPNNLVGLVLFAASLGPGYVYVRVAERHDPRADRSTLAEAVEMVSIGAFASLGAALAVIVIGDAIDVLEPKRISRGASDYLVAEPVRGLLSLFALFVVAYGSAWLAAWAIHRRTAAAHIPGTTGWWEAFRRWRPTEHHLAVVTVELRDKRKVVGVLRSFTSQHDDNRELVLTAPIGVVMPGSSAVVHTGDQFLILREQDVLYVGGRYEPGYPASKKQAASASPAPAS